MPLLCDNIKSQISKGQIEIFQQLNKTDCVDTKRDL